MNHTALWNLALRIFEVFVRILLNVNLPSIKFSWYSCSMWDKLDSIGSGNFSVRGYLRLIWKDSVTHLSLCEGRTSFCTGPTTYRKNSPDCYLCFRLALFHSMSYFFFLHRSHSSSLCTIFDAISYNIDEVLLINPSANMFI